MSEEQYQKLLDKHDWFYYQSDSTTVWQKGFDECAKLKELYTKYPNLKKLYDEHKKLILHK